MSDEIKTQKFIELRATGLSLAKISKEIDVSKPTLIKWSKEFQKEIHNLTSIHLEDFKSHLAADRHSRIQRLLELSSRIDEELRSKSLSDLSVDKLFELSSRVNKAVDNLAQASLLFDKGLFGDMGLEGTKEIDI